MSSEKPDDLDIEEAAVKAALRRRATELKEVAARAADPRPWIEERPWTSCAAAAGLGLAAGWVMAAPAKPAKPESQTPRRDHEPDHHRSMSAMLMASLVPAIQPMVKELVDATLGSFGMPGHGRGPDLSQAADVPESMTPGMASDNQVV